MKMYTYKLTTDDSSHAIAVSIDVITTERLHYTTEDLEEMDTTVEEIEQLVTVEIEALQEEEEKIAMEIDRRRRFLGIL